jgi:YggT family protein
MIYVQQAMLFLMGISIDLYVLLLLLRILMQLGQANFYDPMCQFVAKATQPVLRYLQSFIPTIYRFNLAALSVAIVLISIKTSIIWSFSGHPLNNVLGVFLYACGSFLQQGLDLLFYAILIDIILSWVNPGQPLSQLLRTLTAPLMNPIRAGVHRLLQGFSYSSILMQIDITPIPAMIFIKLAQILLVAPLLQQGQLLAVQSFAT